jgi:hypothetical protein
MKQFLKDNWFKITVVTFLMVISFFAGTIFQKETEQENLIVEDKIESKNPVGCEDIAIELEEKYQNISAIKIDGSIDNYEKFTDSIDKQCPFISTTFTSQCLDRLILKKETELENLIDKITKQAQYTKEKVNKEFGPFPEVDFLLEILLEYEKSWEDYSELFCSVVVANIGGTAIGGESRKCKLFQIEQYIQLLKDQEWWIEE